MFQSAAKRAGRPLAVAASQRRGVQMAAVAASRDRREGDISDSFASLAGVKDEPLPDQFRQLKLSLVEGREEKIKASWDRLLQRLEIENDVIAELGSKVVPEIRFDNLEDDLSRNRDAIKKRGAAVIRGVIAEDEARQYKSDLEEYIRKNPQTKGSVLHTAPSMAGITREEWFRRREMLFHEAPRLHYHQASHKTTHKSGSYTGQRHSSAPARAPTS